jgi:hypothetical protein
MMLLNMSLVSDSIRLSEEERGRTFPDSILFSSFPEGSHSNQVAILFVLFFQVHYEIYNHSRRSISRFVAVASTSCSSNGRSEIDLGDKEVP